MRVKILTTVLALVLCALPAFAGLDDTDTGGSKIKMGEVSSDELNASDSLNRITGTYETDFISTDHAYDSPDQYRGGPFSREKAEMERLERERS